MATNVDSQYIYTTPQQSSDSQYTYTTPQQSSDSQYTYTTPLQGEVSVNERFGQNGGFNPGNIVRGIQQGLEQYIPFGKQLEAIPEAIGNQLRPLVGKQPFDQQTMQQLQNSQAQGLPGQGAKLIAGALPALALPTVAPMAGEGALASIVNAGATGATQAGGLNALNQLSQNGNINAGQLAQQVGIGALGGGALGVAGQTFEKIQPKIAELAAGISPEAYQNALQSIKNGQSVFKNMPNNINEAYRELAENIGNTVQQAKNIYGSTVGQATSALANDAPVPVNKLIDIIDSSIEAAGKGSKLNPTAQRSSAIADNLKEMIYKGSNLDDIAQQQLGISGNQLLDDMKESGLQLKDYGINPDDLTVDRIGLHNVKEDLQHQINYNADYTPAKGVVKKWANGFNGILRENPNYAEANDKFSKLGQFLDNPENSWFNNTNTIASKLANSELKSGELADTTDKIKSLESLLPNNNQISNQLQNLNTQQAFSGGLPRYIGHSALNQTIRGGIGLGAGAGAVATHGLAVPFELGAALQMSPAVQRTILQTYGAGRQIPQSLYQYILNQGTQQQGGQ